MNLNYFNNIKKKKEQLETTDNAEGTPIEDDEEDFDEDEVEELSNQMIDRNISGSSAIGGETYEETRVKDVTQALLRFESILARCPDQSVRWQFGGQPLWCSMLPEKLPPKWPIKKKNKQNPNSKLQIVSRKENIDQDDDDDDDEDEDDGSKRVDVSQYIPKCEHCGSSRVFELELMPTLIFQLNVSDHVSQDKQNDGMDFGCITVYTCLNQCKGPQTDNNDDLKLKYIREYVHVQPPI